MQTRSWGVGGVVTWPTFCFCNHLQIPGTATARESCTCSVWCIQYSLRQITLASCRQTFCTIWPLVNAAVKPLYCLCIYFVFVVTSLVVLRLCIRSHLSVCVRACVWAGTFNASTWKLHFCCPMQCMGTAFAMAKWLCTSSYRVVYLFCVWLCTTFLVLYSPACIWGCLSLISGAQTDKKKSSKRSSRLRPARRRRRKNSGNLSESEINTHGIDSDISEGMI